MCPDRVRKRVSRCDRLSESWLVYADDGHCSNVYLASRGTKESALFANISCIFVCARVRDACMEMRVGLCAACACKSGLRTYMYVSLAHACRYFLHVTCPILTLCV